MSQELKVGDRVRLVLTGTVVASEGELTLIDSDRLLAMNPKGKVLLCTRFLEQITDAQATASEGGTEAAKESQD